MDHFFGSARSATSSRKNSKNKQTDPGKPVKDSAPPDMERKDSIKKRKRRRGRNRRKNGIKTDQVAVILIDGQSHVKGDVKTAESILQHVSVTQEDIKVANDSQTVKNNDKLDKSIRDNDKSIKEFTEAATTTPVEIKSDLVEKEMNGCDILLDNSTKIVNDHAVEVISRKPIAFIKGDPKNWPARITLTGDKEVLNGTSVEKDSKKDFIYNKDGKNNILNAYETVSDTRYTKQKQTQFWAGQKRKVKRNYKITPVKTKVNNDRSWLDFDDGDEKEYSVELGNLEFEQKEVTAVTDKRNVTMFNDSKREGNDQLNAYKSRFMPQSQSNIEDAIGSNMDCNKNESTVEWNNAKVVKKDSTNKIGVNVNNLDDSVLLERRKAKKHDGTKRSRRKTEPFDFEKQSDCNLSELMENYKIHDDAGKKQICLDIPNNLCSFLTETVEGGSKNLDNSRSLFSGSISDTGLFIPSANVDHLASKRDSFQRIFDADYNCEASEDDVCSESDSSSDDVDIDSDDNEMDERGEGVLLPPEPQLGNVEYKLKLVNPTKQRFEHLVTQMKWRLREGRGEAVYGIGVRDCGRVRGLRARRLRASLRTLRAMAARLGAECALLAVVPIQHNRGRRARYGAEVLVRKVPDDQHNIELRVAVMGSNDAGKSTLVGVLTQGELDNGRGSARLNMFRHLHEVRSGRTSSVSHEILGFDSQGCPINYAYSELSRSEEILERSTKLVALMDLAGHRKYLRTTVQGLTGYSPHLAMLVVSATAGINQMTLEHLALVVALDLPFFVVLTKCDCLPPQPSATHPLLQDLSRALMGAGCRRVPLPVSKRDDVVLAAWSAMSGLAVPVFPVSSVTGAGLGELRWFLFLVPPNHHRNKIREQEPVEFQIDETFKVSDANGPVVAGLLRKGVITEKTKLLIGPLDSGEFASTVVESLHRNRAPCRVVRAGQAASLRLSRHLPGLRQGMVLLTIPEKYPHSTDISEVDPKIGSGSKNVSCVSKEEIFSRESDQQWNSEKVSPKACKRMRKRMNNADAHKHNTSKDKHSDYDLENSDSDILNDSKRKSTKKNNYDSYNSDSDVLSDFKRDPVNLNLDAVKNEKKYDFESSDSDTQRGSGNNKRNTVKFDTHVSSMDSDKDVTLERNKEKLYQKRNGRNGQMEDLKDEDSRVVGNENNNQLRGNSNKIVTTEEDCDRVLTKGDQDKKNRYSPEKSDRVDIMLEYDKGVADRIHEKNNIKSSLREYEENVMNLKEVTMKLANASISGSPMCDEDIETIIRDIVAKRLAGSAKDGFEAKDLACCERRTSVADVTSELEGRLVEEDPNDPRGCFFFQAKVTVLHNSSPVYTGFQSTMHIGSVRQTAVIEGISCGGGGAVLGAGQNAVVLFRFLRHPEYLRRGARLLFREGLRAKGVGHITRLFPHRP